MNGATAEPELKNKRAPRDRSTTILGRSQNFFLTFKNPQKSNKKSFMLLPLINMVFRCQL